MVTVTVHLEYLGLGPIGVVAQIGFRQHIHAMGEACFLMSIYILACTPAPFLHIWKRALGRCVEVCLCFPFEMFHTIDRNLACKLMHTAPSWIKMAMGNYPLDIYNPYPYLWENILPANLLIPVHGQEFFPIPLPMRVVTGNPWVILTHDTKNTCKK